MHDAFSLFVSVHVVERTGEINWLALSRFVSHFLDCPHESLFRKLVSYCEIRGHPYMTSALRGEGGLAQKKM